MGAFCCAELSAQSIVRRSEFLCYDKRTDAEADLRGEIEKYVKFSPQVVYEGGGKVRAVYEQQIEVPASWNDFNAYLHVENVGGEYSIFVNGVQITEPIDRFTPTDVYISKNLEQGANTIAVVVVDEPYMTYISESLAMPERQREHIGNRIDFSKYGINVDKPVKVASGASDIITRNTASEISPKESLDILKKYSETAPATEYTAKVDATPVKVEAVPTVDSTEYRIIGEAFDCYVMVEYDGALLVIDKHAAHERIIFEDLKRSREQDGRVASQALLLPVTVLLTPDEMSVAEEYKEEIESIGFELELQSGHVNITAIPDAISIQNAESLITEMLDDILSGKGNPELTEKIRREKALYQVACKAAIKGGRSYDASIIDWLVSRILALPDIIVCPHGRPIAFRLTKTELDRQFDRIK